MPQIDVDDATERYFDRVHRAALVLTGNPWDADDLTPETFLELARQDSKYEGRSSLFTWIYGILLNLERRHRRRSGLWRRKLQVLWGNQPSQEPSAPAAEARIEVEEWKASLWGEVARLPDGQRHALVLRFSEHLAYEEIAEVLNCPLGTVKSRIHHGLATLKERLGRRGGSAATDVPTHAWEDLTHVI